MVYCTAYCTIDQAGATASNVFTKDADVAIFVLHIKKLELYNNSFKLSVDCPCTVTHVNIFRYVYTDPPNCLVGVGIVTVIFEVKPDGYGSN